MATQLALPIQLPADVNLDSPQLRLFAELEQACRPMNRDSLRKCLHKDFRHNLSPRSLGEPERNREEWVEYMASLLSSITMVDLTLHSITEAPGKVVVHATGSLKSSNGSMTTEEMGIFHIVTDEDGSLKVKQIDEVRDSNTHVKWLAMAGITNK